MPAIQIKAPEAISPQIMIMDPVNKDFKLTVCICVAWAGRGVIQDLSRLGVGLSRVFQRSTSTLLKSCMTHLEQALSHSSTTLSTGTCTTLESTYKIIILAEHYFKFSCQLL